jgi:integrative and conjugative element protein (TIGR02256 family)
LHCGTLPKVNDGLPLCERELIWISIPPDFPFRKPDAFTDHIRFAGWPHVQWGKNLCLYQASDTEWDPADGIFGFIDRLWTWLRHGALNELNPTGLPIHPPVTYTSKSKYVLVPKANTPALNRTFWAGWVELRKINEYCFNLLSWHSISDQIPSFSAPAILHIKELPWEMPTKLDLLLKYLEIQGIQRSILISLLRFSILKNEKDKPLLFIIGTPQRGIAGTDEICQHLMAWQIDELMVDSLRISIEKFSEYEPLREIEKKAEQLTLKIAETIDISWIRVLEDRGEVTIRRDVNSPLQVYRGANICLWGCGAIGSHVAYFLAKAGVKRIVLVDSGIVKPGLLVRQMYEDDEIGLFKAKLLASRLLKLWPDLIVESYTNNILEDLEPGIDWTRGADLVLDCTASDVLQTKLEFTSRFFPGKQVNIVSMIVGHRAERGIVVISPRNYSGSVKDVFRKTKIAACRETSLMLFCEDFYPKTDKLEFFQPEPGCSDATFIGSIADVCALSANMLNLIALELSKSPSDAHSFLVTQPHITYIAKGESIVTHFQWPKDIIAGSSYQIRISSYAWNEIIGYIRQCRRIKGKSVETGGVLFGKRDDTLCIIWIDAASGPPPDSKASRKQFICGTKGVEQLHESWKKLTRGSVEYIGMWHTHPEDIPFPSKIDLCGMARILTIGDPPPKNSLLLIVGLLEKTPIIEVTVFNRINLTTDSQVIQADVDTIKLDGYII